MAERGHSFMIKAMRTIVLIAHNLRSCHNVGSLLRTAEGLGLSDVILSGYTPYPEQANDERLPHLRNKIHRQIQKTALGAERTQHWQHIADINRVLHTLHEQGYTIATLEQTRDAVALPAYSPPEKIALLVGREVEGVEPEVVEACDLSVIIPMFGQKESFNVVQAAAMGLYHCRFYAA
jgi:23S rRNA (guanosine2251-2'-O)-methyltransferase